MRSLIRSERRPEPTEMPVDLRSPILKERSRGKAAARLVIHAPRLLQTALRTKHSSTLRDERSALWKPHRRTIQSQRRFGQTASFLQKERSPGLRSFTVWKAFDGHVVESLCVDD